MPKWVRRIHVMEEDFNKLKVIKVKETAVVFTSMVT